MAIKNRDVSLQALALGTQDLPLGGEDVALTISYEEQAGVVRGIDTAIKTRIPNPGATAAISCYAEDRIHQILLQIDQQRRRPGGAEGQLSGIAIGSGENVSWEDCVITQRPDTVIGVSSPVLTWTLELINWRSTPVEA